MRSSILKSLRAATPASPSIEELRTEFAAHGTDGWLWPWVASVLMASAIVRLRPRYNSEIYSPTGEWDEEGIWQLVIDFMIERCDLPERLERVPALAAAQVEHGHARPHVEAVVVDGQHGRPRLPSTSAYQSAVRCAVARQV